MAVAEKLIFRSAIERCIMNYSYVNGASCTEEQSLEDTVMKVKVTVDWLFQHICTTKLFYVSQHHE